jgi:uncharacterized repeat protein (TIGR01451 family)
MALTNKILSKAGVVLLGIIFGAWLWPGPALADGGATQPFTTSYTIEFSADWTEADQEVPLPVGAHFSPLIGAVHNGSVTFWQSGQLASAGIEAMAELGQTGPLSGEINAEINQSPPAALSLVARAGNVGNTETVTISPVTVNRDFPLLTLVTMVAPSPDWFVGVGNLSLLEAGHWKDKVSIDLFPYDAGTEQGSAFALDNPPQNPPLPIANVSGVFPFKTSPLAQLTVTRVNYSDLHVSQSVSPQSGVAIQSPVTYTLVLSNSGDTAAGGAVLSATLPTQTFFARWLSQPPGAVVSSDMISWAGSVPAQTALTFSYVVTYTGQAAGQLVTSLARFSHTSAAGINAGQTSASFIAEATSITNPTLLYLPLVMK